MKKIKPFTIKQVIAWLKRQKKSATFQWSNNENEVCLFSKFMRDALKGKGDKYIIGNHGQLIKQADYLSETFGVVVPFHDDFWKIVGICGFVTRGEAIKILTKIGKMYAEADTHNTKAAKLPKVK